MAKIYAYQVVGEGLVMLTPVGGAEHPDHSLPGGGEYPDIGLPGGRPDHIWGGGRPGRPGRPDQGLPGGGGGSGIPDQSLPPVPPPTLLPGYTLVMVRTSDGKWHYAALRPGVPVQPLPEPIPPGGAPDQGLPPQPPDAGAGAPSQPIQPTPAPKVN